MGVLERDVATVGPHEALHDRQPEAEPALARPGGAGPPEAVERPRPLLLGHPGAVVADLDPHVRAVGHGDDRHLAVGRRDVERVAQEVVEHLLEASRDAAHLMVVDVGAEPDAPLVGDGRPRVEAPADDVAHPNVRGRDGGLLGSCEHEQPVDESRRAGAPR